MSRGLQDLGFGEKLGLLGSAFRGNIQPFQAASKQARQRQEQQKQQQQQKQLAGILSGQQTPAFARPGGAEFDPQQFRQGQLAQLGALGTPEANEILREQALPSSTGGSALERIAGRIMEESNKAGQPVDFVTAISLAKSGLGQGLTFEGGEISPIAGALQSRQQLAQARESGVQEAKSEFEPARAGERKTAEKEAELQVARRAAFPKLESAFQAAVAKNDVVIQTIDEVLPKVGIFTAGFFSPTANIKGTPATDLKANIDTILANIGFEELQAMRDNSPTGGALGQVAVRELELLQATFANITNSQSPSQLRFNLRKLKKQVIQSRERLDKAFNKQARLAGIEVNKKKLIIEGEQQGELSNLSNDELIRMLGAAQ